MSNTAKRVAASSAPRSTRGGETRAASARQKQWQPASLLPDPTPLDGVSFRWVRKSMMGDFDPTNFSRSLREGWETCSIKDHPEMRGLTDPGSEQSGLVEIGGLVLCKMPAEFVEQRSAHMQAQTDAQQQAVDNNLMREEDPRMPLLRDSKTKVQFGSGV